jgi:hypothetical protein
MAKNIFVNQSLAADLINKFIKFTDGLNIYHLSILFSLLVLAIHPAITEHVEFALAANQDIHVSEFNYNFVVRMLDPSAQVSFLQFLLNLNLSPRIVQILVSYLATLVTVFSVLNLFKFIDSSNKYSNLALLVFFSAIYNVSNPINAALYPWSPRVGFFEFGNQGMWLCLASLILLIRNRKLGFLLSGILFSWHMVWFLPILLYLSINFNEIEKKNFLYFFIGLLISFFFLHYGNNDLASFVSASASEFNKTNFSDINLQSVKITDSFWSAHNPIIFGKDINFYYLLVVSIPIISLNYLEVPKHLLKFCNTLFLIALAVIFYLEIARYYPLPFSSIFFRAIVNRFFNLIMAIFLYYFFFFCLDFKLNKKKLQECFLLLTLLLSTLFYFNFSHILRLALFIFLFQYYSKKIKYLGIFFLSVFMLSNALKHHKSTDYDLFSFLYPNKIEKFLSSEEKDKGYIVSWGIQSFRGLNITNLARSEYFIPTPPLKIGNKYVDIFCYESLSFDSKNIPTNYWDVDKCFESKSKNDWEGISNLTGADYVIVSDKVKLDLKLVIESDRLRIYSITN